jgi:hypothetical protein
VAADELGGFVKHASPQAALAENLIGTDPGRYIAPYSICAASLARDCPSRRFGDWLFLDRGGRRPGSASRGLGVWAGGAAAARRPFCCGEVRRQQGFSPTGWHM